MTIALIDGDVVAYTAAFAAQRNIYYIDIFYCGDATEQHQFVSKEEAENFKEFAQTKPEYAHHNFVITKEVLAETPKHAELCARQVIMKILGDTKAIDYKLFLTSPDKSNFRYKIAKTKPYKGNRKAEKPVHYAHVRDYLHKVWEGYVVVGEEADDYLGIEQCNDFIRVFNDKFADFHSANLKTIICSIDKDLKMIPGWHYNIKTGEKTFVNVDDAMRFFWKQMLMGDTVDNIQGVSKVGKIKANRMIDDCLSLDKCREKVQEEYKKSYKNNWEEIYNEMGNLLWIKREPNVIFEDLKL
jgi:hypothetical protein